ncbi:unnamed protein product [Paramecium octaurelia]|uniref:Uncharacterized protein n=1 Tax=Paramecium octaurelia TaxID=43137 RepID=A0A8S1YBQ5_PAROT|nr:unnamed protein product [Paramecium octaurelia]
MGNCTAESIQQYENVEFTEGDTYEGEMENGFAEGWGVYTRKNGDQYIGWWHNGFQHGIGKEIFADKTEYEGTFVKGKKHGKGKITFPDGSSYEGQFQKDSFSGEGVYIYPNGMNLVSGLIIEKKAVHRLYSKMVTYLNANTKMIRKMGKVYSSGQMDVGFKVTGQMDNCKGNRDQSRMAS